MWISQTFPILVGASALATALLFLIKIRNKLAKIPIIGGLLGSGMTHEEEVAELRRMHDETEKSRSKKLIDDSTPSRFHKEVICEYCQSEIPLDSLECSICGAPRQLTKPVKPIFVEPPVILKKRIP